MSLVIGTSAQRGFTPHTVAAAAQTYIGLLDATVGGAGPTRDWNMDETSGNTMAARVGGVDGSYQGGPKLAIDALVQDPGGRKAIGVRDGQHVTIASPLTSASFEIVFPFQPDKSKSKHVNLTTGQTAGGFSLEWIDDGASGLKVRFWRVDSGGTAVVWEGSSTGQIPVGTTSMIYFSSDGSTGSLDVHVGDGTSVTKLSVTNTSGTPPASWPNLPAATTWRYGIWVDGSTDPTDGVLGPPTMWDSVLSSADRDSLNVPQSILWIDAAIDMGSVDTSQTITFDLARFVHPESGYTVTIDTQPSGDESAAANGLNVDITGGADPVTDTTFTFHLTKGALTSQTCTGTFDVASAGASEFLLVMGYTTSDLFTTTFQGTRVFYAFLNSTYEQTIDDYHAVGDKVLNVFTMREDNSGDLLDDWVINDNFQAIADAIVAKADVAGADGVAFDEFSLNPSGTPSNAERADAVIASMDLVVAARPNKLFLPLLASGEQWLTNTSGPPVNFRAALDAGEFEFAAPHLYPECDGLSIADAQNVVDTIASGASSYIPKLLPNYLLGDGDRCACANPPATASGDSKPSGCASYSLDELITYTLNAWLTHANPPAGFALWWKGSGHIVERESLYSPVLDTHYSTYV